jgi:tRNA A-37 threonylcarbamoyl transferase component Bud32/tetratricopeptide (TPR) repeat protein
MRSGTTISHYLLGDLIGQGGMGEVYQATDTRLDRQVALKFLAARYVSDPEAKERFIREAKSASALDHPNICTIHDIGETEQGELYIVMALYEGETLDRRLRDETFTVERTVHIVRQVAEALKRAHAGGIIHRDVKPANTMVSDDDAVRLLDFGVAKLQAVDSLTQTGVSLGTSGYMSPEQAVGDPVSPASDVWSLGVMAYEMLAGRRPFDGDNALATVHQIVSVEPRHLAEARSDIPAPLTEVVHRALAKKPTDRFANAAEFLLALDAGAAGLARAPSGAGSGFRSRRFVVPAAVAVIAATITTVLLFPGPAAVTGPGEASRDVIAVLPFAVTGAPELNYLSEGLVTLVGGRLDGAGPLRTIDPRAVLGRTELEPGQGIEPARGAALAMELGAGRFVTGELVGLPGRVSLSARIHEVGPAADEYPLVTLQGSADSLAALVDQLATGLLANSLSGANARIQRGAAQSSGSPEAVKEFLRGEQFHRRGQFDSASAAYNRALGYDSAFALAHLMKSMNNAYTYETDDYMAAVNAMRFSDGLPERDRSLIEAFRDQQSGRITEAEQGYLAHLKRWPDEVKALLMLGMLYRRANPRWGRPIEQARPFFQGVLEHEPENVPALHNLAQMDAGSRLYDSLPARAAVLRQVAPGSEWAIDVQTMTAFALGDTVEIERLVESFPEQSLLLRLYAVYNAMRFSPDPGDAVRLLARQESGRLNTDTGLPRSAAWDVWNAELVAADLVPVDDALMEQVLENLLAVDPEDRLRNPFEPLHDIFSVEVATLERDFTAAKLLARLGRVEEAWAIQRRLAAHPPYLAFESLNQDAPGALAADLYVLQGDRQRALEVLRGLPFQLPMTAGALSVTAGSHARHLRAELELELGDPEVARYLYAGLVEGFSPPDKLFLANAYDRLGQIAEAAGRTEDAVYYYDRFVRAWTDADSQLQPRRTAVEARLDALRGVAVSATGASAQGG